jgi:hypothetical protein
LFGFLPIVDIARANNAQFQPIVCVDDSHVQYSIFQCSNDGSGMITQAQVMSLDQAQVMSLESNCSRGIIATLPKQKGCGWRPGED